MKKTMHTMITAAIFAAAAGGTVSLLPTGTANASNDPADDLMHNFAAVYGPPWMFYDAGDSNMDRQMDARDLTLMKRAVLLGEEAVGSNAYHLADVNDDGTVDKADLLAFRAEKLGFPQQEQETTAPVTTTRSSDTTEAQTAKATKLTTLRTKKTRTETTATTDEWIVSAIEFTDTAIVPLYGPVYTVDWSKDIFFDTGLPEEPDSTTTKTQTVDEAEP